MSKLKHIAIVGGCGFVGSHLAEEGLRAGNRVSLFDSVTGPSSEQNLAYLRSLGTIDFTQGDLRDLADTTTWIKRTQPDVIFHVAGQVAAVRALTNPLLDFEMNALGTLHLLEAVRQHSPQSVVVYASTNKVYGDLVSCPLREEKTRYAPAEPHIGFDEKTPLDFKTPYGCSKGAADQYVKDYAVSFGLKTIVLRFSAIVGPRQTPRIDQGWVAWFVRQALEVQRNPHHTFTVCGSGKQVRDIVDVKDAVSAFFLGAEYARTAPGDVFNIGGGMTHSLSILELISLLEEVLKVEIRFEKTTERLGDQRFFVCNTLRANERLNWSAKVPVKDTVSGVLSWDRQFC